MTVTDDTTEAELDAAENDIIARLWANVNALDTIADRMLATDLAHGAARRTQMVIAAARFPAHGCVETDDELRARADWYRRHTADRFE